MAHSDSARKRNRQNIKANLHNRIVKSDLRSAVKALRGAATDKADQALRTVESKLDKAAKRNIIPTGRANRLKARLKKAASKASAKTA